MNGSEIVWQRDFVDFLCQAMSELCLVTAISLASAESEHILRLVERGQLGSDRPMQTALDNDGIQCIEKESKASLLQNATPTHEPYHHIEFSNHQPIHNNQSTIIDELHREESNPNEFTEGSVSSHTNFSGANLSESSSESATGSAPREVNVRESFQSHRVEEPSRIDQLGFPTASQESVSSGTTTHTSLSDSDYLGVEMGSNPTTIDSSAQISTRFSFGESASVPFDVPPMRNLRPSSTRQFYQQRQTALQTGQSYTRIEADSFSERWLQTNYDPSHEDWLKLLSYEAQAMSVGQGNNPLTVMIGDSISLWFPTEYMSRYRFWLNQSISGDTALGTLQRLHLFEQTNPDIIHVMVGINDLKHGVPDQQLLNTQQQIIRRLRQQHPQARIIVHSILPTRRVNLPSDRIRQINERLRIIAAQEGAQLVDLHRYFVDESGQMDLALTTDGLHLNETGYALWYRVLNQMRLV